MLHKKWMTFVACLLLCCLLVGCSDNVQLEGNVTYSDDGSPLGKGMVMFDNGTIVARGPLEADGSYTVGTDKDGDGLPPGTYTVTIVDAAEEIADPNADPDDLSYTRDSMPSYRKLIADKYFLPETSGLEITVDASTGTYDITVDRAE